MTREPTTIWTIGHSTHTLDELVAMLKSFQIELLADIRRYPGSKRYPQFNKEFLASALPEKGFEYVHFEDLGGRRSAKANSENTAWRLPAFRGYADYMETPQFQKAIEQLAGQAAQKRTAYMCSEAVWWSCHRALVSDFLKVRGWQVMHIMSEGKATEHPYTSAATVEGGHLSYNKPDLFG
jgi:uncharacterized protein (DUF488 family)